VVVLWLAFGAGMLLTMADTSCGGLLAGHAGMSLYGPSGLSTLVSAFRTFVNVRDVGLKVREFGRQDDAPVVTSDLVTITPITLTAVGSSDEAQGQEPAAEPSSKRQRLDAGSDHGQQAGGGGGGALDIASVALQGPAACYLCELPDVPGKFLPHKVSTWRASRRRAASPACETF
jgi:hypothetical protein